MTEKIRLVALCFLVMGLLNTNAQTPAELNAAKDRLVREYLKFAFEKGEFANEHAIKKSIEGETEAFTDKKVLIINEQFQALQRNLYGKDDRKDVQSVTTIYGLSKAVIQNLSRGVVAIVHKSQIDETDPKHIKLREIYLKDKAPDDCSGGFCGDVPYRESLSVAMATGFIISPTKIMTAEHTLFEKNIDDYRILLDFNSGKLEIDAAKIRKLKSRVPKVSEEHKGQDFDIIEVHGVFTKDRIIPVNKKNTLTDRSLVFMIGFPSGISMKVADNAEVYNKNDFIFYSNLDAFSGNSGSPVFNKDGKLEGILTEGAKDFIANPGFSCCSLTSYPVDIRQGNDKEKILRTYKILSTPSYIK